MVEIPFYGNEEDFSPNRLNIVRYYESQTLDTYFKNLEFVKSQNGDLGKLWIKNLPAGDYLLYFLWYKKIISVKVFRGAYWVTDEFVVAETGIAADLPKPKFGVVSEV